MAESLYLLSNLVDSAEHHEHFGMNLSIASSMWNFIASKNLINDRYFYTYRRESYSVIAIKLLSRWRYLARNGHYFIGGRRALRFD